MAHPPIQREPVTSQVVRTLKEWIRERELSPDDWIRQEDVARRLGVSRVPVREALSALAAEGLVEVVPHRGVRVTRLSWRDFLEATVLRSITEAACCRFVVSRATEEGVERLERALAAIPQAADADADDRTAATNESFRRNWDFHMTLFGLADFGELTVLIENLWLKTVAYRRIYLLDERLVSRDLQDEHERMVEAVRRRDADDLVALHASHRARMLDHLRTVVFADEAQGDGFDWLLPGLDARVSWGDGS
jgi:DNA-binding GntR family transcriptional regulator